MATIDDTGVRSRISDDIRASAAGWAWLRIRQAIRWGWFGVGILYTFVIQTFVSFWTTIWADITFLAIVFALFAVIFVVHAEFEATIKFVYDNLAPFLQAAFDIFVIATNLILDLYDIVARIWNECVQIIGFIFYILIEFVLKTCLLIITSLGPILVTIFSEFLEVLVFFVSFALNLLRVLIEAPMGLLKYFLAVAVKIVQYLMTVVRVLLIFVKFAFEGLMVVIRPILYAIKWTVELVSRIFGNAKRSLLGLESHESVGSMFVGTLQHGALLANPPQTYAAVLGFTETIDMRIKEVHQDNYGVSHPSLQFEIDDSGKQFSTHDYIHKNNYHSIIDQPGAAAFASRGKRIARSFSRSLLSIEEEEDDAELFETAAPAETVAATVVVDDNEEEDEESDADIHGPAPKHGRRTKSAVAAAHDPVSTHGFHKWMHQYVREMGHENVFHEFSGHKRLEHKPIESAFDKHPRLSNLEHLHRVKRAHVAISAMEHAFHHVKKKYFDSGHFGQAVNTFVKRQGFRDLDHMTHHYVSKFPTAEHVIHTLAYRVHQHPFMKYLVENDPDKDTLMFYPHYMEKVHNIKTEEELQQFLLDNHTPEERANMRVTISRGKRGLLAINLEILYQTTCYSHPRNPLCLPNPRNIRLKKVDVRALLLPFTIDANAACSDLFRGTSCSFKNLLPCFFSWNLLVNAYLELRYVLYLLDIPFLINPLFIIIFGNTKPSTIIKRLGLTYSWFKPISDFFFPLDYGVSPSFRQYICIIFIGGYSLLLLIFYGILAKYFLAPWINWFIESRRGYLTVRTLNRQELEERYQFLETFDETLLRNKQLSIQRQLEQREKFYNFDNDGANNLPNAAIGADMLESGLSEEEQTRRKRVEFALHPEDPMCTVPSDELIRFDDALLNNEERMRLYQRNLQELDERIEALESSIERRLDIIFARCGITLTGREKVPEEIEFYDDHWRSRSLFMFTHHLTRAFRQKHERFEEKERRRMRQKPRTWGNTSVFGDPLHFREEVDDAELLRRRNSFVHDKTY